MDDIIAIHKQVERTLRRLTVIAERVREGIVVFDLNGVIQFVNAAWAEMHRYKTTDELAGKQISAFYPKGRRGTDVTAFIEEAKQKGRFAGRLSHVRRDKTPFFTEMLMVVFNDEAGKTIGLVGFATDLTEQERTKDELEQYRRAAWMNSSSSRPRRWKLLMHNYNAGPRSMSRPSSSSSNRLPS